MARCFDITPQSIVNYTLKSGKLHLETGQLSSTCLSAPLPILQCEIEDEIRLKNSG